MLLLVLLKQTFILKFNQKDMIEIKILLVNFERSVLGGQPIISEDCVHNDICPMQPTFLINVKLTFS